MTGDETLPFEIAPATLAAWRQDGLAHAVLDVREPWEVEIAALEGALLVPMGEVPARLGELPADRPLVVLCHHGGRSMRVTAWLRSRGLANAVNLGGGIDAWSREVDPAVPTY
ncbi:MAG: rhodanese-like domain-containing protein [Acetobacteraceae bacterium]|nr:rhodanese-like domain-containing protein [Acetobacteraceae bacterium]